MPKNKAINVDIVEVIMLNIKGEVTSGWPKSLKKDAGSIFKNSANKGRAKSKQAHMPSTVISILKSFSIVLFC